MKHRGAFTVFAASFAVVLIGGLALAQVGVLRAPEPVTPDLAQVTDMPPAELDRAQYDAALGTEFREAGPVTTTQAVEEKGPRDDGKVEPTDEPKEEPKEEPSDETKVDEVGETPDDEEKGDTEEPEDTTPPRLEILHPEDGQVFHEKSIAFEGITERGAVVTAGRYKAEVNNDGAWRIVLILSTGSNVAKFKATDAAGNVAEASVVVVYEPKKEEPRYEFTAKQKYGSSSATPPFDVFYGTAHPNAKIWIESEYGGKTVTASSGGHWEARVEFPEAPVGKWFRVVIESSDDGRKVFEFVRKGDAVTHEFTANQKYGSCGEKIPYDLFWGRADAGEKIWVESPYGGGVAKANAEGHWELRVDFPEAPPGKVFEVFVEAEHGGHKVFSFVNTGGEEH